MGGNAASGTYRGGGGTTKNLSGMQSSEWLAKSNSAVEAANRELRRKALQKAMLQAAAGAIGGGGDFLTSLARGAASGMSGYAEAKQGLEDERSAKAETKDAALDRRRQALADQMQAMQAEEYQRKVALADAQARGDKAATLDYLYDQVPGEEGPRQPRLGGLVGDGAITAAETGAVGVSEVLRVEAERRKEELRRQRDAEKEAARKAEPKYKWIGGTRVELGPDGQVLRKEVIVPPTGRAKRERTPEEIEAENLRLAAARRRDYKARESDARQELDAELASKLTGADRYLYQAANSAGDRRAVIESAFPDYKDQLAARMDRSSGAPAPSAVAPRAAATATAADPLPKEVPLEDPPADFDAVKAGWVAKLSELRSVGQAMPSPAALMALAKSKAGGGLTGAEAERLIATLRKEGLL